jgi:hypothetical protein
MNDPSPKFNRAQKRLGRRSMRMSGKVPSGIQARWEFLKRKGHPAAGQYGAVAKMIREQTKLTKEKEATNAPSDH